MKLSVLGVIAADAKGSVGICFYSKRMHSAWEMNEKNMTLKIYKQIMGGFEARFTNLIRKP